MVWRFADYLNELPLSVIDLKDPGVVQSTINAFMTKVYTLCKMVRAEELDESWVEGIRVGEPSIMDFIFRICVQIIVSG